jgi:transposase
MERADRETWAKRVERWKDSGLSAKEFAGELGVSPKSLAWWKWELTKKDAPPRPRVRRASAKAAISPLTFVEMSATPTREPLEVVLASGARIRVPADFDSTALGRLVELLDKRR